MEVKKVTVLGSDARLHRHKAPRNHPWRERAFNRPTSGETRFNHVVLPLLDGGPLADSHPARFPNDDYQIALVRRGNRNHRPGSLRQTSARNRLIFLPLTWRELLDRVRGTLNRSNPIGQTAVLRFGEVRVDFATMEISRSDQSIVLTAQEFKLLKFFSKHPKRVLSRNELLNEVWGYQHYPCTRTVDNHVWALRKKLELNPAGPIHFLTVRGVGYKFVP